MGINSRNKGHNFERRLVKTFRENGFSKCVTSRSESKNTDDLGVDLMFCEPFQVQAKAQERLSNSPHKILGDMPSGDNLLFWKKNNSGTVVCMSEELFWRMFNVWRKT